MQLFDPKGYALACDSCGRRLSWGGRRVFGNAYAAVSVAKSLGWKSCKGIARDLCPECREKRRA